MAEYFLKVNSFTRETPVYLFVGAFKDKTEVGKEFERVKDLPGVEVITDDTEPQDAEKAIKVEIVGKTEARKVGMRHPDMGDSEAPTLIATTTPDNILDLAIKAAEEAGDDIPDPNAPKKRGRKPGQKNAQKEETLTPAMPPVRAEAPIKRTPVATQLPIKTNGQNKGADTTIDDVYAEYSESFGVNPPDVLIVSKFPGTINWLRQHGVKGRVMDRIRHPEQIENMIVIGTVPYRLAALAFKIGTIDLPGLRVDQLGKPLSADELDQAGASIKWYTVREG